MSTRVVSTTLRIGCTIVAASAPALAAVCAARQAAPEPARWPQFRGKLASGVEDSHPLPDAFSRTAEGGLDWETEIPGLSHSSPIVWGERVFVQTAVPIGGESELKVGLYGAGDSADDMVEHGFLVLGFDRRDGSLLWEVEAARRVPSFPRHTKATHANSTPATDGRRVVALFGSEGLFCYDLEGELRWQVDLGELDVGPHDGMDLHWGFASSPILVDGKVVVQCDVKRDAFLAAFDVEDGKPLWRVPRDDVPGWSTPTAHETPDGWTLLVNGCKHLGGYRLADGSELWRMAGGGGIPVPAPVAAGGLLYFTSNHRPLVPSHPQSPIFAVRESARGELPVPSEAKPGEHLAWARARHGTYMQTPLVYRGVAYFCQDSGVVAAFDAASGEELFRERIGSGSTGFSASPVAGDGKVYFTSEEGDVVVLRAGREFAVVSRNALGEICMATPAIAEGSLLFRARHRLIAVGAK